MGKCTVIVAGRLGSDPEFQYANTGTAVARFSIPADIGWGDNKKTEWIKVTVFGKSAEFVNRNLRKGSLVEVVADLDETWVNNNGKATIQVTTRDVTPLADFGGNQEVQEDGDFDDLPF